MRFKSRWGVGTVKAGVLVTASLITAGLSAGCANPASEGDEVTCGAGTVKQGSVCVPEDPTSGSGAGIPSSSSSGGGSGGDSSGGSGGGGAGGSSGEGGAGGSSSSSSGSGRCNDSAQQPCYDGSAGTQGVGVCHEGTQMCVHGSWGPCVGEVTPSAEACDGLDNNCDGAVDEGMGTLSCGVGQCASTTPACANGQPGTCIPDAPSPEACDGLDNNCDGQLDEGDPGAGEACSTGMPGGCAAGATACVAGVVVCDPSSGPMPESCNGIDDDCNGVIDEGDPGGGLACSTGLSGACAEGTTACTGGQIACDPSTQPSADVCDGIDNDCNGAVDEGCPTQSVLSITTTNGGKVVADFGEVDCRGMCTSVYTGASTTFLSLNAVSDAGFQFVGWSGDCAGTGSCAIGMSAASPDVTLTATFAPTGLTYDACPTENTGPMGGGTTTLESIVDMVVLCDGWMLYAERTNNKLWLSNVIDGTAAQSFQLSSIPRDIALDQVRGLAYVVYTNTQRLTRVDLTTGEVANLWVGDTIGSIAVSDEGVVFLKGSGSTVRTLDGTTSDFIGTHSLAGSAIDYNDATDRLITSFKNYFYDHATDAFTEQGWSSGGGSGSDCVRVYVSPDGNHAAKPCGAGNGGGYSIYDFYSHNPSIVYGEWGTGAYPSGASFSPNSEYALLTNRTHLQLFSVDTHALLASYPGSSCPYHDMRKLGVSLDSRYLIGITHCGFNDEDTEVTWQYHDTSM